MPYLDLWLPWCSELNINGLPSPLKRGGGFPYLLMIKRFLILFFLLTISSVYARVDSAFNSSATGTTSATVFVPKGIGPADVRSLAWRIDANVTTAFVGQYIGVNQYSITSSTASAATVLWFANAGTAVTAGSFIIFYDDSATTYFLRRVSAATTTSVTLNTSIAVTTTTSDLVWQTTQVNMPVGVISGTSGGFPGLWLPTGFPTALVIDGNTTSCAISVSGARGDRQ